MAMSLMRVMNNDQLMEQDRQVALLADARLAQSEPFVLSLSHYIKQCYDASKWDREVLNNRMLKSLRQRMGQYEPEMLAELEKQGGNQIYMLITQTKCRGAEAWMRDVLLSTGMIPWDMMPTPVPELDDEDNQSILEQIATQVKELVGTPGLQLTASDMKQARELATRKIKMMRHDQAKQAIVGMKKKISDQLYQGKLVDSVDEFLSDLTTFPFAVLKGPIITNQPILKWGKNWQTDKYEHTVEHELAPTFKRVSPFDFYYEPGITNIQKGYTIERHELSRRDVIGMLNQPGYNQNAVRLVLEDYDQGMLNEWLDVQYNDLERRRLENRRGFVHANMSPAPVFKALEFCGSVSGKMLLEWGRTDIEEVEKEYEINGWLIGRHVVRAVINTDPLHEKPYRISVFNKVPGSIPGISLPELISDTQAVCNAAARAIVNNMAIASGPQVEVNIDRLPPGEKITEIYPWKIWQATNDPLGSTAPAVRFEQPTDNTQSLMQVFEKFARQSDEQSGIPGYIQGDTDIQGAGRTASGLSMLMGSAGKGIRQIITGMDQNVIQPMLRHLYRWNMKYCEDETIKGDADVVMKGTSALVKEQVNLRRNEFLQATANEQDAAIVGPKGRAAILRETAIGLEMDVDKVIPNEQELELQDKLSKQHKEAMNKAEQIKARGGNEMQMQKQNMQMQQMQQKNEQTGKMQQQKQQATSDAAQNKMQNEMQCAQTTALHNQAMDNQKLQFEREFKEAKLRLDEELARSKNQTTRSIELEKAEIMQETELQKTALQIAGQVQIAKMNGDTPGTGVSKGKEPALTSSVTQSAAPLELSKSAQKGIGDMMGALTTMAAEMRKQAAGSAADSGEMKDIKNLLKEQARQSGKPKRIKIVRKDGQINELIQETK